MTIKKQKRTVDTDNIQGSIWPRLPKNNESYLFFKITNKERFRQHLRGVLDRGLITTGTECEKYLRDIGEFEEACAYSRRAVPENERLPFTAINIAFTHMGLLKVEHPDVEVNYAMALEDDPDEYCRDRLNEGLFEKGMFDDLVYEFADNPETMDPHFRAPPGNETKTGLDRWKWRVDGVFIVAAQSATALRRKIADLEGAFHVGEPDEVSMEVAFRKNGNVRPGANRGKEHFGYEDHISQPKIQGLDEPPAEGEPQACPPGYIFLGHQGDPDRRRNPKWAKEGSYLVFRQLDQKVPEFESFLEQKAKEIPGDNYAGENGPEKLGAHMMGRWKSGAPVAKAVDQDDPKLAFDNKFDFRPKKSIKGCPFAAHARKMRPRADKKKDHGTEDDGDDPRYATLPKPGANEAFDIGQMEDASVILRRGITFGPELTEEEKRQKKTLEHRGIYFTCYQSLIRDGFNFLITRWGSNAGFPEHKDKTHADGPGMDPIIRQRLREDHPEDHISLYDGKDASRTVKVDLGVPWVDPRGGEYFFTPSLRALREHFSADIVNAQGQAERPVQDQLPEDPVVRDLREKVEELEQKNRALQNIVRDRVDDIGTLHDQLKEQQELHRQDLEKIKKGTLVGYAGLIRLDFLNQLADDDLRELKHQIIRALGQLAGDVDWKQWQSIIGDLNNRYGFQLNYGHGGHFEGEHWRKWKEIQYSTSASDYDRTVAFRNRMGQWCSNSKWNAAGGDAGGCALMWLTFVIQLHDVLRVYRPEIF